MPPRILNTAIKQYLKFRYDQICKNVFPYAIQNEILLNLLSSAKNTDYGNRYNFSSIKDFKTYQNALPLVKYDDLSSDISKMMEGYEDILWPGKIKYFSKSSGTTKQRSKFIPISDTFLRSNLIRSSWDTTAFIYHNDEDASLFYNKSLIMGGSLHSYNKDSDILVGDVSAIMINTIPIIGRPFYAPDFETALLSNWDEKIERVVKQCLDENIVMFGGVPTWNLVLFNKIKEVTGKDNMLEIWPELKYYLHGGVNFSPYKSLFRQFIPTDDFNYIEAYNASEGYFAIQDEFNIDGMRLLVNNGIFYEFIEKSQINDFDANKKTLTVNEVEEGVEYAIIISTASGLWRYIVGDTVKFNSLNPLRMKVTGRVEHFINSFGEELMVDNADNALIKTIQKFDVSINEYTVAPYISEIDGKGYHEWVIEFNDESPDIILFEKELDKCLREINSDYDAKRYNDMAMTNLKVRVLPKGSFYNWLRKKNRLGGQYKVPRLQNDRKIVEELLSQIQN